MKQREAKNLNNSEFILLNKCLQRGEPFHILKSDFCYRKVQLINYIQLTWKEKYKVYRYRSSVFVRKGLGNEIGSFSAFLQWVEEIKKDPYRGSWWVKDFKDRDVGSINLKVSKDGRVAYFSIFKVPSYPKGGSILMETLLFVGFELIELRELRLVVFKSNLRAYNLYKKFQFEEVKTFTYKGKEVVEMVLKKDTFGTVFLKG